jgi:cytochrome P450
VDGERLADEEIIGFVGLLLLAGHITTTATLGNSVVCFDEHPDAVAEIRADPTLLAAAIEEVLRLRTPFPRVGRMTRVDTEVGAVPIPAGQILLPWLTAANRDERVFADPDRFDINRVPNPHLTFGHGIHFCLGAPLARLEGQLALASLLRRFPELRLATGRERLHWGHGDGLVLRGLSELPVIPGPARPRSSEQMVAAGEHRPGENPAV